jgi:post-segregation antitoxin (ccd killing protein)
VCDNRIGKDHTYEQRRPDYQRDTADGSLGRQPDKHALFDPAARRKTVSVTLNGDLVAKATEAGITLARPAETAVAHAYAASERERARQGLREANYAPSP